MGLFQDFNRWLHVQPPYPAHATEADKLAAVVVDDQSNEPFLVVREDRLAWFLGTISMVYSICAIVFLVWLLVDTWSGRNWLLTALGFNKSVFVMPSFRLMATVAIGGALGGAVDAMRSVISWHCKRSAYGKNYIWKDISLPLLGTAVALIAYAIVRSGIGAFSGDVSLDQKSGSVTIAGFAISTITGFSSLQAFRWLDAQGNKIFGLKDRDQKVPLTIVPRVIGKTVLDAKEMLAKRKLTMAKTSAKPNDIVSDQSPAAGATVNEKTFVTIEVGAEEEN